LLTRIGTRPVSVAAIMAISLQRDRASPPSWQQEQLSPTGGRPEREVNGQVRSRMSAAPSCRAATSGCGHPARSGIIPGGHNIPGGRNVSPHPHAAGGSPVNATDQRPGQAGADVVRSHAQRAGADIVEVEGSHVIMISQPQVVTDHILTAARAVAASHW
jgi:hypothetical protein